MRPVAQPQQMAANTSAKLGKCTPFPGPSLVGHREHDPTGADDGASCPQVATLIARSKRQYGARDEHLLRSIYRHCVDT